MSRRRSLAGVGALWFACVTSACSTPADVPGSSVMGTFAATATLMEGGHLVGDDAGTLVLDDGLDGGYGCSLAEVTGQPFDFKPTLSRDPATGNAWMTLVGASARVGAWDGQIFRSSAEARRSFPTQCGECAMTLEESLELALLSRSQSAAVGNTCPDSPLDGGIPEGFANVKRPQETEFGFDSVRVCGELVEQVKAGGLPDGGACPAECGACRLRYRVTGERI